MSYGSRAKKRKWVDISKKRVHNILNKHRVCSRTQLETKISEAGPSHMRPEPIFITQALNELTFKSELFTIEDETGELPHFYVPPTFDSNDPRDKERLEKIKTLYKKYKSIAGNLDYCGSILEEVVYKSAMGCSNFVILGAPGSPPRYVNGHDFSVIGWPEFVFTYSSTESKPINAIVECKNIRNWLYPESHEIWELFLKAAKSEMIPILVTRKIAYPAWYLFKSAGAIGFEMHRQYFNPDIKNDMEDIIHKDELGFHNIAFSSEKEDRITKFFDVTVNRQIDNLRSVFYSNKEIILDYAEELSNDDINPHKRKAIYNDAFQDIVRPEWQEPYEEHLPDEYL